MDAFLAAESPRARADIGGEGGALGGGEEGTEARGRERGGAEGGFDDEGVEVLEDVVAGVFVTAPPSGHAGQREFFAEDFAAERGEKREEGGGLERAAAELVGQRDVFAVGGVDEAGDAEERVAVEFEGIAERGVDSPDDGIQRGGDRRPCGGKPGGRAW